MPAQTVPSCVDSCWRQLSFPNPGVQRSAVGPSRPTPIWSTNVRFQRPGCHRGACVGLFSQRFPPDQLEAGFLLRSSAAETVFLPFCWEHPPAPQKKHSQKTTCPPTRRPLEFNPTRFPEGQRVGPRPRSLSLSVTSMFTRPRSTYMRTSRLFFPAIQTEVLLCHRTHPQQWHFLSCVLSSALNRSPQQL